jgi:nucleoside-diphosphate-sugar epimerase
LIRVDGRPRSDRTTVPTVRVVIAGGHGKIGRRLAALLAARGDVVIGVVRNPDHIPDLNRGGAEAVVCDLEATTPDELAVHLVGADAVVFAAGAGPGSGVARKDTVDRAAAVLLAEAARRADVRRYLLVSSTGVDDEIPEGADDVWAAYLQAKKAAEESVLAFEDLDWTVLRPGRLTDDPGTGRVLLSAPPVERGDVTRDDTAAVLAALLDTPGTAGLTLELRSGEEDVLAAVTAAASFPR